MDSKPGRVLGLPAKECEAARTRFEFQIFCYPPVSGGRARVVRARSSTWILTAKNTVWFNSKALHLIHRGMM